MWYWINVHTHKFADTGCSILGRIGGISHTGTGTTLLYLKSYMPTTTTTKNTSPKCYISKRFRQFAFLLPRKSMGVIHAAQIELALLSHTD